MKNLYILFLIPIISLALNINESQAQTGEELLNICNRIAKKDGAKYLKDFTVKLNAAPSGEDAPRDKNSFMLRKNTQYRFSVCSSKDYDGKAIVKVYDSSKLLGSNYVVATGKVHQDFEIKIQKTGAYHVFVEFEDGKEGLAVIVLSFVEKF
ncbi:MAG: hypothetical protein ACQESJ_03880 [Bacteroidota bacterium]